MSRAMDRQVYEVPGGRWTHRRNDTPFAYHTYDTKRQAVRAARRALKRDGGSILEVSDRIGLPTETASCRPIDGSEGERPGLPPVCDPEERGLAGFLRRLLRL